LLAVDAGQYPETKEEVGQDAPLGSVVMGTVPDAGQYPATRADVAQVFPLGSVVVVAGV